MNRAVGVNFEMEGGENGLPVINGEGESSKMVPVDIEMRGDEEYSEVTKHGGIVSITCQCRHLHFNLFISTFKILGCFEIS